MSLPPSCFSSLPLSPRGAGEGHRQPWHPHSVCVGSLGDGRAGTPGSGNGCALLVASLCPKIPRMLFAGVGVAINGNTSCQPRYPPSDASHGGALPVPSQLPWASPALLLWGSSLVNRVVGGGARRDQAMRGGQKGPPNLSTPLLKIWTP